MICFLRDQAKVGSEKRDITRVLDPPRGGEGVQTRNRKSKTD